MSDDVIEFNEAKKRLGGRLRFRSMDNLGGEGSALSPGESRCELLQAYWHVTSGGCDGPESEIKLIAKLMDDVLTETNAESTREWDALMVRMAEAYWVLAEAYAYGEDGCGPLAEFVQVAVDAKALGPTCS